MSIQKLFTVGGNIATLYNGATALGWHDKSVLDKNELALLFEDNYTPNAHHPYYSYSQISASPNIWVARSLVPSALSAFSTDGAFLLAVQGVGDLTDITSTDTLFWDSKLSSCVSLTLPNVKDCSYMFRDCYYLTAIPDMSVPKVEDVEWMFGGCSNVSANISATYQMLSNIQTITSHYAAFYNCGSNTVQGAAELALIPDDWKHSE